MSTTNKKRRKTSMMDGDAEAQRRTLSKAPTDPTAELLLTLLLHCLAEPLEESSVLWSSPLGSSVMTRTLLWSDINNNG